MEVYINKGGSAVIRKHKKIALCAVFVVMLISAVVFAATKYPYALVSFNGIKMVTNGSTTQGFVDITLKKINATGISFCLSYDKNYVELSDVATNEPIQNPTTTGDTTNNFNVEHKYFTQNTEIFSDGVFRDISATGAITTNLPIIGIADADTGHLIMNFLPKTNASSVCSYIEDTEVDNTIYPTIMANDKGDLKFGSISFKIKDPAAFSKLTESELKEVIKIVPFSEMINPVGSDTGSDEGIQISYVDENEDIKWYSRAVQNINYEFDIQAELSDVKPQVDEITVSSYEIYNQGTFQDLLDFLNERMSMLTLYYSDTSQVPGVIKWTQEESDIGTITWNPKEGDYIITQPYNDKFSVSVKVHVTPINLIDFAVENENITYWTGASDFPTTFEQLNLAKKARPVLDTYIPNGGVPELTVEWYSLEGASSGINDLPADFGTEDATYNFIGHLKTIEADFSTYYPWLTVAIPLPDIKMTRSVVTDEANLPKELEVISSSTDSDGVLTIVVQNSDGTEIPDNTVFNIRMPGGEMIDTTSLGARYSVTITDGVATITITPDITLDNEKKLAQLINLGNRAGSFSIASTEPDKTMGPYTDFAPDPRRNIYTGPNYEFDYSSSLSAVFPVKEGTSLPTTVTLPLESDRIVTTYSGYDGTVPGQLKTFTVDDWIVIDGDINTAGSVVTVTGTLLNTSYTNYGEVVNDDGVTVTIKYYVTANDGTDSIDTIPDAIYDKRQEGYGYDKLQTKSFTVHNNGTTDIYGLSAVISLSADNGTEAFVMTKELQQILASGESTEFDITTKIGLPVIGDADYTDYVCTVSLLSNNAVLQTFNISFTVTKQPTYEIKITIEDAQKDFGSAKTQTETYTAQQGETVTVIAEPEVDCKFTGWTVVAGDVTFADASNKTTTFEMPDSDVEIRANFEEMLGAKLRAEELYVKDVNDINQTLYDEDWQSVQFDPVTRTYYVAVPNDTDKVKLWFKLRTEAESATLALTHEHDTVTDTLAVPTKENADDYFKTQDIDLEISPVDNLVTLSITYDDPSDNPDEGEVTRKYEIHIYRKLKTSELMTFEYGNSPYGLIMRDTSLTDADKAVYKQAFIDNNNTFIAGNTPSGGIEGLTYLDKAWSSVNYDLDDSALFVINNTDFTDSGYKRIVNSIGETVSSVNKKIKVNLLAESVSSLMNGSSDDFVYITSSTINLPATGQISQLKNERIRPDCYELVYSFTDFDGTTVEIKKPLIILSSLGDVNVDDAADGTDVSRVLNRFSTDLADNNNVPDYNSGGLLFRYRVCDVNKDGNVNAIDANNIRANELKPFYTNLSEGGGAG